MSWNDSENYTPQWSRVGVWLAVMAAVVIPGLLLGWAVFRWVFKTLS